MTLFKNKLSRKEEVEFIIQSRDDISKFKALYDAYYCQILNYINHKVMNKDLAADLCSQVFLKAMIGLKSYEIRETSFSSWLYKIAYNEVLMVLRRKKIIRPVILDDYIISGIQHELPEYDKEALLTSIESLLKQLEEKDVELIELKYYENKSFKEIGTILSCSENTAKVRMHRLIMKLKKELLKTHRDEKL